MPFFPIGGFQPLAAAWLDWFAARHRATAPQVALAWLLARAPNILPIPGTGSLDHLAGNLAAGDLELSPEDIAELTGW
ncbi:aldo/keto reductase [Amorphoplanes digitatis]|uniref:Aryl-alcohol dehydrogenase-like predicted oxidoreductase n=1 Tax=Actinoplanes digitatis TaxID=1868 RepID=A0A7W7I0U2_9ACTN|nr:aldo/keto reductase [Actinoplanes digitatis]MBB4764282.1 aryl-alcohol dehydrogenase-like predicted oxidoreductase [Actinoplanes digitatis]